MQKNRSKERFFLFLLQFFLCHDKHELDAVFLVDAGGAGVVFDIDYVESRIKASDLIDHALCRYVARQAAKRLHDHDILVSVIRKLQHFCGKIPALTHAVAHVDDALCPLFEVIDTLGGHKTRVILNGSVFMYFAPDATVEVDSPYDDLVHYATLSESHRDQIIAILNGGEWKPGSPDMRPCDYSFTIFNPNASAKVTLRYSSEAGVFLFNDHYLRISNQDMNTVNEIFEGYAAQMPCA